MSRARLLLVNPRITSPRHARFPLSLLTLASQLGDRSECSIVDGNVEPDPVGGVLARLATGSYRAVGISVMGGPQVRTAIELSQAIRSRSPATPIIWGGYFPSLYPQAVMNAAYVDYAIRSQGGESLAELLHAIGDGPGSDLSAIAGLSWRQDGHARHNAPRAFAAPAAGEPLPYGLLADPQRYCARTFLGQRTVAHQAAVGCRFRCTFCGVAAMFRGATSLPAAAILDRDLRHLRDRFGADSVQFFDHNFFDREEETAPLLEVLARLQMPWWCYARADALLNLSSRSWSLVRSSRLRMAYIGAESPSDQLLHDIRKGTRSEQTLEVARLCQQQGVIPEFSFMVAPPHDPEGATEQTFSFIRQVKRINPQAEIIVYIYTPVPTGASLHGGLPQRSAQPLLDFIGQPVRFPESPDEWTEQRWVDYACHADAPWITERLRQRIRDFVTVLRCRFPTTQDSRSSPWGRLALRSLASWRYRFQKYDHPWELNLSQNVVGLADPRATGI